jgi:hypothetical protein
MLLVDLERVPRLENRADYEDVYNRYMRAMPQVKLIQNEIEELLKVTTEEEPVAPVETVAAPPTSG